jgi:hypothetical protein
MKGYPFRKDATPRRDRTLGMVVLFLTDPIRTYHKWKIIEYVRIHAIIV